MPTNSNDQKIIKRRKHLWISSSASPNHTLKKLWERGKIFTCINSRVYVNVSIFAIDALD